MIKKVLLVSASVLIFQSALYSNGIITYNGIGAGGQISFVATEYYGPAFGFGFHGVLELLLGNLGTVQYNPSICLYFNQDRNINTVGNVRTESENHNRQVSLNILDARYFFPVPTSLVIHPYAGFGICIVINNTRKEITTTHLNTLIEEYNENSNPDTDGGFNMFAGIDFPVNKTFVPYVETRFTASQNRVFRLTGGMTFRF